MLVMLANHVPKSPSLFSKAMITIAPTTGPTKVPKPPTKVINTTKPDIDQCTSVKVPKPNTTALVEPAKPASAADKTKASNL